MRTRTTGEPHGPRRSRSAPAVVALALAAILLALTSPTGAVGTRSSDTDAPSVSSRQNPTCFGRAATIVARPGRTTVGTSGNDVIVGTAGDDRIFTGGGRTIVCAGGGDDVVYGGARRDRIRAGAGADIVYGGGGRDLIVGGAGRDRLVGGPARDVLRGGKGPDRCDSGAEPGRTRSCRPFTVPPAAAPDASGPLVTFSFDDGTKSNPRVAAPLLEAAGYRGTFYLMSGYLDEDPYLDSSEARTLYRSGHEVGSHSVSHPYLTTLSDADLRAELVDSQTTLEAVIGGPVTAFAAPYGDVDVRVLDVVDDLYTSNRMVLPGFNYRGAVPRYGLLVRNVTADTPVATVEGWLDDAVAQNAWMILTYHDVVDAPTTYDTTPGALAAHIDAVAERNLPVVTISEGLALYG